MLTGGAGHNAHTKEVTRNLDSKVSAGGRQGCRLPVVHFDGQLRSVRVSSGDTEPFLKAAASSERLNSWVVGGSATAMDWQPQLKEYSARETWFEQA